MGEQRNSHSSDANPQVGLTLKKTREEFGLTHEDVERATKIRVRYLEAMERDDYDALPGAVYAQGFLKTYANYLDLNGEKLSRELRNRRGANDEPLRNSPSPDKERRRENRPTASGRFRRARRRRIPIVAILGAVLAFIVLAVVVAGLYFVGLQASRSSEDSSQTPAGAEGEPAAGASDPENPAGGTSDEGAGGSAAPAEPPGQGTTGAQETTGAGEDAPPAPPEPATTAPIESPPPESLTMELRVQGNISWLNIESDGEVVFSQVAESGFAQTFEANDSITVWSGNAGAVFISVNGQDYGQLGGSGQTVVREFNLKTAEG